MSEKIPSIGNYLTQDSQTAIVEDIAGDTCLGRIAHKHGPVVWDRVTGKAFLANGTPARAFSIVSPAPIPWRERILKLIETARRDPTGSGRLISGDVTFYMDCSRVTVFREAPNNSRHTVYLKSPEIIGAFKARMTQLAAEAARAHDDAHSAAIEALLQ